LPLRSNIPKLAEFTFSQLDADYPHKAWECKESSGHLIVAGHNYGQGSSREHAAITPRYLGLHAVLAKSFARIHWQNLANFGILALEFVDQRDYDRVHPGDTLVIDGLRDALAGSHALTVTNAGRHEQYLLRHQLSPRQVDMVLAGGQIPLLARTAKTPRP
jgi:aconitase A